MEHNHPRSLRGKTLFITGASRGIGKAIAMRAAADGANVVVAAKTTEPHPKLPGTIHSAAEDIERAGGRALAVACDIRFEDQVSAAVDRAAQEFGGIDVLVNNASAIQLTDTPSTDVRRFDLMHAVNARGTWLASKYCIEHLSGSDNPHILVLAPPLRLEERWFAPHLPYSMAKFGMSLCVLGLAGELRGRGIAVNALWPRYVIATAAVQNLLGGDAMVRRSLKPEIVADAAYEILVRDSREFTGRFCIDTDILAEAGKTDIKSYAVDPDAPSWQECFFV